MLALPQKRIRIPANGWRPRHYQMPAWSAYERGIRRFVLVWHRRAGKDEFALHAAATSAFTRVGTYWHMLPEASQARKAIWEAINPHTGRRRIDEAFPRELRETTREQDMMIRFVPPIIGGKQYENGSTWQVVGSDNFNSLVGSPPIGVVFSEYALADPAAWAYLRPILAENGGWAMFISTTRGRNHLHALHELADGDPEWFGQILTVDQTQAISAETLERERRELIKERGPDEGMAFFLQEWYCSWDSALPGAYYGSYMALADKESRVGLFPWIPGHPVITAWDLGVGDSTAIWFIQVLPAKVKGGKQRFRVVDYLEASGMGLEYYVGQLRARPYAYREHLVPHDAGSRSLDREEIAKPKAKILEELGLTNVRVIPAAPVDDGIAAVRKIFGQFEFNTVPARVKDETEYDARARMGRGLSAIRGYHRKWDERLKAFSTAPTHDWCSHGADGLRTFGSGYVQAGTGPFPASAWKTWEPKVKSGEKPEPPECVDVVMSLVVEDTDWSWQRWGVFLEPNKKLPSAIVLQVNSGTGINALTKSLTKFSEDSILLWRDKELKTVRHELLRAGIVLRPIETLGVEAAIDIAGQAMKEGRIWAPAMTWASKLRLDLDRYPHGGPEQMALAFAQVFIYVSHHGYLDEQDDTPAPEPRKRSFY